MGDGPPRPGSPLDDLPAPMVSAANPPPPPTGPPPPTAAPQPGPLRPTIRVANPDRARLRWLAAGLGVVAAIGSVVALFTLVDFKARKANYVTVGDCVADFDSFSNPTGEIEWPVQLVGCGRPHAMEAYAASSREFPTGKAYPGDLVMDQAMFGYCEEQFEAFVGVAWEESELDYWVLGPDARGWLLGDRVVVCLIGEFNQTLTTGTLEGAGR